MEKNVKLPNICDIGVPEEKMRREIRRNKFNI